MIKRWICWLLAGLAAVCLSGCYRVMDEYEPEKTEYRVAASCYPMYALSLMVLEEAPGIRLTCLTQPQAGCLRAYQFSEWDAIQAAGYDALILGGRGLESYESTLLQWTDGPIKISAMQGLTLRNNGVTAQDEDDSHYDLENPWLFLSPDGAVKILRAIAASMANIDPDYAQVYQANLTVAEEKLTALGDRMRARMEDVDVGRVALMHEGLPYFAEFMGVEWVYVYEREPGEDVTDNMLMALMAELEEARVDTVLMEKEAPATLVRNLEAAGYEVCRIDTLTAHGADGDAEGYIRIMEENTEELAKNKK